MSRSSDFLIIHDKTRKQEPPTMIGERLDGFGKGIDLPNDSRRRSDEMRDIPLLIPTLLRYERWPHGRSDSEGDADSLFCCAQPISRTLEHCLRFDCRTAATSIHTCMALKKQAMHLHHAIDALASAGRDRGVLHLDFNWALCSNPAVFPGNPLMSADERREMRKS